MGWITGWVAQFFHAPPAHRDQTTTICDGPAANQP